MRASNTGEIRQANQKRAVPTHVQTPATEPTARGIHSTRRPHQRRASESQKQAQTRLPATPCDWPKKAPNRGHVRRGGAAAAVASAATSTSRPLKKMAVGPFTGCGPPVGWGCEVAIDCLLAPLRASASTWTHAIGRPHARALANDPQHSCSSESPCRDAQNEPGWAHPPGVQRARSKPGVAARVPSKP
jgi:hypothetical protein